MCAKQLIQKGWSVKNEVNIQDDHLQVKRKTINEDLEYTIKFEELGFEIIKKVDKSTNFAFYFLGVFDIILIYGLCKGIYDHERLSAILIGFLCLILFGFLCVSAYKRRNQETIQMSGGSKTLELLATIPDRVTVSDFVDDIHNYIRVYYKSKYTNFDNDIPHEEKVSILRWLKQQKYITDKEFDELNATHKTENIIGFKPYTDNY